MSDVATMTTGDQIVDERRDTTQSFLRRHAWKIVALASAAAIVAGLWSRSTKHDFLLGVSITGDANIETLSGERCTGAGAFSDVRQGALVAILDASGRVIASSTLGVPNHGQPGAVGGPTGVQHFGPFMCTFPALALHDVKDTETYQLRVGSHLVGPRSKKELAVPSDCCNEWLLFARFGE